MSWQRERLRRKKLDVGYRKAGSRVDRIFRRIIRQAGEIENRWDVRLEGSTFFAEYLPVSPGATR